MSCLSNVLSPTHQSKSHVISEEYPDLENTSLKRWWFYNCMSPWKHKFELEIFCFILTGTSPCPAAVCHLCSELLCLCDNAQDWETRTNFFHLLWEYHPSSTVFKAMLRNLTKHSFLGRFLQHCCSHSCILNWIYLGISVV